MTLSRRRFMLSSAACAATVYLPAGRSASPAKMRSLSAAPTRLRLLDGETPETQTWAYNSRVPGPVLRVRPGEMLDLEFENRLPQPTTVHWHGMRVPNAMDGVPHLTQPPIPPGGRFRYSFPARNSGTFWYHPHFASSEQLDRGLHGAIVVEEHEPPAVDRDLVWVLDDWRLDGRAQIAGDFGNFHDAAHQGRLGNTATVNGAVPRDMSVRAGERIRLRLVNVANAWIFGLDFRGHQPRIIALDGHGVSPHAPAGGLVLVGPAQRVDLILDLTGEPGQRFEITDRFYPRRAYKLLDLVYESVRLRPSVPSATVHLPRPDLPTPDLENAGLHEVRFSGGAMGGMRSALYRGREVEIRELARMRRIWAINGVVAGRHDEPPMLHLSLGRSYRIDFVNDTAFAHPVHLHGHPMKVLEVSGRTPPWVLWRDTLLLAPRTRASVALVADNPGRWMLHCHIPEHQEAGMMAVVEVA